MIFPEKLSNMSILNGTRPSKKYIKKTTDHGTEIGNCYASLFWGKDDTFITIYNEPMLIMLQKIHGVTAVKEVKKLDFDQRISASIHNHHH